MRSYPSEVRYRRSLGVSYAGVLLVCLTLVAGCHQSGHGPQVALEPLDLTQSGPHASGDWTYVYSISNPGSRSEGYHGELSYKQIALPAPMHVNDFYETPWGPLYWIGDPVVPFGAHGWMPKPLAREPLGQALIDPAIVHTGRFLVQLKVVAPEELATPDRLERNPQVLAALKPFELTEVHVQSDWFPVGSDPITLHDTKRWGTLKVCRADTNQNCTATLEFTCTGDLTVDASPRPASLSELMAAPEFLTKPTNISLSPQIDALQPIRCMLSPVVGDPLVLYVVCRIQDQGPTPPWKTPPVRYYETGQP